LKPQKPTLTSTFELAVDAARAQAGEGAAPRLAVALSGGLDSSVLLQLAHAYAQQRELTLCAFHVHHGLSPNADAWLAHCERACAALGVSFEARRIQLQDQKKSGTEAAARKARYAALGALCREHGVPLLLTAHHLDDQAETVLLQLLRGRCCTPRASSWKSMRLATASAISTTNPTTTRAMRAMRCATA
jgi:tRNA(Ile)-lysidine synthase